MTAREETAYHEAGHAVAHYARGIPMVSASIVKKGSSLGRLITESPERFRYREHSDEILFALLVGLLAGIKAAERLTDRPVESDSPNTDPEVYGSDYHQAMYLALALARPSAGVEDVFERAGMEAARLIGTNWAAVEAVAERLLERNTLDAATLEATLERAGCERDDGAVRHALLEEEHEQLLSRCIELGSRYQQLSEAGDADNEIAAAAEEYRGAELRRREVAALLWPEEDDNE